MAKRDEEEFEYAPPITLRSQYSYTEHRARGFSFTHPDGMKTALYDLMITNFIVIHVMLSYFFYGENICRGSVRMLDFSRISHHGLALVRSMRTRVIVGEVLYRTLRLRV
jgi:hypothetical protein